MGRYLETNFWRGEGEDAEARDVDTPAHAQVAADVEPEGIPDDSHFLVIDGSLHSVDPKSVV
jgi:hypothetical protein